MLRKTLFTLALVVALAAPGTFAVAEDQPSPYLTDAEFADLVKQMDDAQAKLLGLISGLSDEQWTFKQNADRWSVGECAEHIVRSERALFDFAQNAMKGKPDPEWYTRTKDKAEFLRKVMPNRNPGGVGGAQAPMEIRPTEHWDRAKTIQEFYKIHGEVRAYIETMPRELKNHTFEHPFPIFNWLNAYDWLLYVPLHTVRHSKQIIEVQQDAKYPKKAAAATAGQ
jgi:hypothetical protein